MCPTWSSGAAACSPGRPTTHANLPGHSSLGTRPSKSSTSVYVGGTTTLQAAGFVEVAGHKLEAGAIKVKRDWRVPEGMSATEVDADRWVPLGLWSSAHGFQCQ